MYARRTSEYSRKAPRESGKDGSSGKAPGLLTGMPLPGLVGFMEDLGFPAYRGRQVFAWLHGKLATSFDSMTDLPASLRSELSECCALTVPQVRESLGDVDGTVKLLLGLADGLAVESVLIPGDGRLTACLSTQVGCPLGCRFCMTGKAGYRRNLRADEIVAQLHSLQRRSGARVSNGQVEAAGGPERPRALLEGCQPERDDRVLPHRGGERLQGRGRCPQRVHPRSGLQGQSDGVEHDPGAAMEAAFGRGACRIRSKALREGPCRHGQEIERLEHLRGLRPARRIPARRGLRTGVRE
jgi:hypothetical protein